MKRKFSFIIVCSFLLISLFGVSSVSAKTLDKKVLFEPIKVIVKKPIVKRQPIVLPSPKPIVEQGEKVVFKKENLPSNLENFKPNNKSYVLSQNGDNYTLSVFLGKVSISGFSVKVNSIHQNNGVVKVLVSEITPQADLINRPVVSYPSTTVNFYAKNVKELIVVNKFGQKYLPYKETKEDKKPIKPDLPKDSDKIIKKPFEPKLPVDRVKQPIPKFPIIPIDPPRPIVEIK